MRHRSELPLRWSDLDLQGHVNNVVYVDYLQEARVRLLSLTEQLSGERDPNHGVVVTRNDITFQAPIGYQTTPVVVETWVSALGAGTFTLGYQIIDDSGPERVVYATACTTLAAYDLGTNTPRRLSPYERALLSTYRDDEPTIAPSVVSGAGTRLESGYYPIQVRFSDLDAYGHANNIRHFDYIQEGRVRLATALWNQFGDGQPVDYLMFVVRAECQYLQPMVCRPEVYDQWTWLSALGRTSYTFDSVIEDPLNGTTVARARVVGVFIDPATGRPTEPTATVRAAMEAALATE